MSAYKNCSVKTCRDTYSTRHRFPNPTKYPKQFAQWVAACGDARLETVEPMRMHKNFVICHTHFSPEDIAGNFRLQKNAVPTLNLFDCPGQIDTEENLDMTPVSVPRSIGEPNKEKDGCVLTDNRQVTPLQPEGDKATLLACNDLLGGASKRQRTEDEQTNENYWAYQQQQMELEIPQMSINAAEQVETLEVFDETTKHLTILSNDTVPNKEQFKKKEKWKNFEQQSDEKLFEFFQRMYYLTKSLPPTSQLKIKHNLLKTILEEQNVNEVLKDHISPKASFM